MYLKTTYARDLELHRRKEIQKQRITDELAQCTFSPKIKRIGSKDKDIKRTVRYINISKNKNGLEMENRLMNSAVKTKLKLI